MKMGKNTAVVMASASTIRSIVFGLAPSASRTAISRDRSVTMYDTTP